MFQCCVLQSAVSWDHKEVVEKHGSQKDYSSGFGGKYGVEVDKQDKSAVGWDHIEKIEKHESQKGFCFLYLLSESASGKVLSTLMPVALITKDLKDKCSLIFMQLIFHQIFSSVSSNHCISYD